MVVHFGYLFLLRRMGNGKGIETFKRDRRRFMMIPD